MKPKEWLKENGHIKEIGRGRMSAAHIALIKDAVASGVEIEGYSSPKPTAQSGKPRSERKEPDTFTGVADVPEPLRDSRNFIVVRRDNGKPIHAVGMANVCNGCHSSFTYCPCPSPRVWLDHDREVVVDFKPN